MSVGDYRELIIGAGGPGPLQEAPFPGQEGGHGL